MKRFLTSKWGVLFSITLFVIVCKLSGRWEGMAFLPVFGTVAAAPGSVDYTTATGNKMIPWQFARKAVVKFYDQSIVPNITNSDFEGKK